MAGLTFNIFGRDVSASSTLRRVRGEADHTSSGIGSSFKKMGGVIAGGLAAAGIGSFIKDSVQLQAQFSGTMSTLQATTGASGAAIKQLNGLAMKLGANTKFSANEAADAMLELAKAGISTKDIMSGAADGTLLLATAGGTDLANAATIASNAMNTFNLKGKDMGKIAAALAGGANASSASVDSLGLALSQVGPGATNAGLSLQETVAVLSAFDAAGIKGADAGTSLKTMLTRLVPQTKKSAEAMKDLGLKFTNSDGSFKSITEVAQILQDKLGGLSDAQRTTALATVFGSDATRAATVLMKQGADGLAKYIKATNDQGAAQKMAQAAMSGTGGALETLSGAVDTLKLQVGTALAPVVLALARFLSNDLIPAISSAIAWVQKHREGFIQLGRTLIAVGKYLFENIVKPIAQAVIPVIKSVIGWVQEHRKGLEQLARFLGGGMKTSLQIIIGVFKFWVAQIKITAAIISWLWRDVIQPTVHAIVAAWHGIATAVTFVWGVMKAVFDKIRGGFNDVKSFIKSAVDVINGAFHAVGDGLKWAWDHTLGPVINLIQGALDQIRDSIEWIATAGTSNVKHGAGTLVGNAPPVPTPGKATGGRVLAGQAYRVFDSPRPELFMPDSDGHIIPDASALMNGPAAQKWDDSRIVAELRGLRRENRDMQRAISSMRLVIDGYQLDTAIGRRADRLSRGG